MANRSKPAIYLDSRELYKVQKELYLPLSWFSEAEFRRESKPITFWILRIVDFIKKVEAPIIMDSGGRSAFKLYSTVNRPYFDTLFSENRVFL
jgi:hypothetical protein